MERNLNRRKTPLRSILSVLLLVVLLVCPLGSLAEEGGGGGTPPKTMAKNVIMMIRDGGGYNEVVSGDYYQSGQAGTQAFEQFPVKVGMSTYLSGGSYDPALAWSDFNYVKSGYTDSAAAATALTSGVKTYKNAIGVDLNHQPLMNLPEAAEATGKSSGVVTTVPWDHATPAGFASHANDRNDFATISTQMLSTGKLDVIMGSGHPYYDDNGQLWADPAQRKYGYFASVDQFDQLMNGTLPVADADQDGLADDAWTVVQDRSQFQALMSGSTPSRVFGLTRTRYTNQEYRTGPRKTDPFTTPLLADIPTLTEMSLGALNVLDNNPRGFFLMIEGGAVDFAAEENDSGRMIEETVEFDQAIQAVINWVEANSSWSETLLIVTGDHESGYLTGPGSDPTWVPITNNGQGVLPGMEWHQYNNHTNSLVPVFAKGVGAELLVSRADQTDPVHGKYLDNTELAQVALRALSPVQSKPDPAVARNVIMMIRDGGGYNEITSGDYYQFGLAGTQGFEKFPVKFGMSTYLSGGSYDPALAWSDFNYLKSGYTDSAAAATALTSGVKTYKNAIGMDVNHQPLKNLPETAEETGKSSGVVTTVPWDHATPAGFASHANDRNDFATISTQMLSTGKLDVIMGSGHPYYDDNGQLWADPAQRKYGYFASVDQFDQLMNGTLPVSDADQDGWADDAWTVIQDRSQFQALMSGPTPSRVFGLTKTRYTNQEYRTGPRKTDPFTTPLLPDVPTLTEMSLGALNVLDNNPRGFFLMIEGGAVDFAAEENDSGRMLEESIEFDQAIQAVVDWVEANSSWSETLLIVTADHESGYLWGPDSNPAFNPIVNNGQGVLPGMAWYQYNNHSNSLVPVFAKGVGADLLISRADQTDPVRGQYLDNTELAQVALKILGSAQKVYMPMTMH